MNYFKDKKGQVFAYDDDQVKAGMAKKLTPLTDAEIQALTNPDPSPDQLASTIRAQRDALLIAADHMVNTLADQGKDATAARAYRQALRDVPEQSGFPQTVTWPAKPA